MRKDPPNQTRTTTHSGWDDFQYTKSDYLLIRNPISMWCLNDRNANGIIIINNNDYTMTTANE